MVFEPTKVKNSYQRKASSYESKYNCGYYTHIHTGVYETATFPFVSNASASQLQKLGQDKIRHYLHLGQELLLNGLISNAFAATAPGKVLDCGAGHGGTALYIADNYAVPVVALTISDVQAAIIRQRALASANSQLIFVECMNVFDADLARCFTHIFGIDAFCQMGNTLGLFQKLSSFLLHNGLVVVSDYFVRSKSSDISAYFNSYWSSNINTLQEILESAWQAGLSVHSLIDVTGKQMPFWYLSIAHSSVLLQQIADDSERKRLEGSIAFHAAMKGAFETQDLTYNQIIFRRR